MCFRAKLLYNTISLTRSVSKSEVQQFLRNLQTNKVEHRKSYNAYKSKQNYYKISCIDIITCIKL